MKLLKNLSILPFEDFISDPIEWDVFIACSSFEERCKQSSNILSKSAVKLQESIIFNYKEYDTEGKKEKNTKKIKENLEKISQRVLTFDAGSVSKPSEGIKQFLKFLIEKEISLPGKKIAVDITTFTKSSFFLLFKVMKERFGLSNFWVIYTEPDEYKSKNPVTGEIILTEGLDRTESIPGFTGSSIKPQDALIVILGFEGKRSMDVFHTINPEITYAINGFPSYKPGWDNISLEANIRFLKESGAHSNLLLAPACDPFITTRVLTEITKEIRDENQDVNISIAPLGTKVQAFGVLLYALMDKKVKVVYPFPSTFKTDYSYEIGPSWIFETDLNSSIY